MLLVYLSVRDRLPDPLAAHIGPGGTADGFSGHGSFLAVSLGLLLGGGVLFGLVTHWARNNPDAQRVLAVLVGGAAVVMGWIITALLLANAGAADAAHVTLPGLQAAAGFGAGVLYAAVGWPVCGKSPVAEAAEALPGHAERLDLADTESAAWTRVAGSRALPATGLGVLGIGVVTGVMSGWATAVLPLVTGALLTLLTGARVTADRRGITVAPVLLPWPRLNVPLERITEVTHRDVRALRDFGGWGYRVRPGASGVVLRSGPAIAARLATGSEFVVTVDDAGTAAALLNTLADRERTAGG
ncbi:hypothetical protein ACFQ2B_18895 [Streptomyces stramineus]